MISKFVEAMWCQIWTIFHKKRNGYNFEKHEWIWTKLTVFHNSPALNTFAFQYYAHVIAPPAGDRKCHFLDSEVPLRACSPYLTQIWCVSAKQVGHAMFRRSWRLVKGRGHQSVAKVDVSKKQRF